MQSHLVSYRRIREVSRCNAVKTANSGFQLTCVLFILSRSNPITSLSSPRNAHAVTRDNISSTCQKE